MKKYFSNVWVIISILFLAVFILANLKQSENHTNHKPDRVEDSLTSSAVGRLKSQSSQTKIGNVNAINKIIFTPQSFPQKLNEDEPEFKKFNDWVLKYKEADPVLKKQIEKEGIELAQKRIKALAQFIVNDPQRALELALPENIKTSLPKSIQPYLEQQINTRCNYESVCVFPVEGDDHSKLSIVRSAIINGEKCRIFTYNKGLDYVTRPNFPINGIAVSTEYAASIPDDKMGLNPVKLVAMSPSPVRLLENGEASGITAPVSIKIGGEVFTFSTMAQAIEWTQNKIEDESLDTPTYSPSYPTAESSYTEGRKRFLVMRVDFPDYQVDALTTNAALTLMNDLSNFMAQVSYSKFVVAPVGKGSDITPLMRMGENVAAYDNAGLSKLYPEARNKARDIYGYDLNKYDFFFVVTGGKPAYSYAGLGYVGGVGFHLANSYFDVRTTAHEFGHNLGLGHANWWNTSDKSMIGDGQSDEYGDPFDTMGGSGGGVRHYSSFFKNKIGWIPNSDCPTATASGIYRLYAQDIAQAPIGVRGIKINRPSGNPYWLEFRQLWTGNTAMMNGISMRWVSGSTILFDTTPGSSGGKDDHSLTIGRTFSDPAMNLFITPLRKAHTYPESLDIAINFGPFPTNQNPQAYISSSTTTTSVNQAVTFLATATDPNGDALAYFWDFGNGTYSTESLSSLTKTFNSAGKYRVSCTVSDLKGGIAHDTILIQVGSSTTYSISGRVLTIDGKPVPGIKVYIDSGKYAFSGSDGFYTISMLSSGTYTVNAFEPVYGSNTFISPPAITVGPDYSGADFFLINGSSIYTPIISKKSEWKYLDDGSNQGTSWIYSSFDDSSWHSGAGILGYGEGNETTVINYGTNSDNKYITYYFRKTFSITSQALAGYTNLLLEVLRDDGIIVYINNVEVFRDNMPTNAVVGYNTNAIEAVEPDNYLQAILPKTVLQPGTNIIAVEVHQVNGTSSDLNFDLALSGVSASELSAIRVVYIDSPKNGQVFYNPSTLTITAQAKTGEGKVTAVAFLSGVSQLGQDFTAPYQYVWNNPPQGTYSLTAVGLMGGKTYTSAPVQIQITSPVSQPQPVEVQLITAGSIWYYLATNASAPSNWYDLNFDHSRWQSGRAELGYGEGDEATRVPYGTSNNKWVTTYFRKLFTVNDPSAVTNLILNLKRDDGAVVYLNGVEVVRDLLPDGEITWSTPSENASDDGQTFNGFLINPQLLLNGTNSLAVEIHQSSLTSSDLSFDLSLVGYASTNRNRGLWITTPTNNSEYSSLASIRIAADVVVGGELSVSNLVFYSDNSLIYTITGRNPVYSFDLQNLLPGVHQIYAVATDSAGLTVTSAPVQIFINSPPMPTAFVSFGDRWKYLDDGSNQDYAWRNFNYDDRNWKSGFGKFGYGKDGELTVVNSGTNSSLHYVTTYFRKTFVVSNSSPYNSILLNIIRDDGIVVYINGNEVFRDNMLDGVVSFNSLALRTIEPSEENTPIQSIIPVNLVNGTNIVAVEVHQVNVSSSDIGFDMEMLGLTETNTTNGIYITSPYNGANLFIEQPVVIKSFAVSGDNYVYKVDYYINYSKIGDSFSPPYQLTWNPTNPGTYIIKANAIFGAGRTFSSAPITINVLTPSDPVEPLAVKLINTESEWKFWDNLQQVSSGWQMLDFNDTSWPSDYARFGFGYDGEKTLLTEGRITHYFRKSFFVTNIAMFTELEFRLQRDDGAVVYLNGKEVFRNNMPSGNITASTLASTTINTPDETAWITTILPVEGLGLLNGTNVVAVELHQSSSTSSDAGFDLELVAYGDTAGRVIISNPIAGSAYLLTNTMPIYVSTWAGYLNPIQKTELYVDGVKLGELAGTNSVYNWTTLLPGERWISARSYTASGKHYDSQPVNVIVGQESTAFTLINSNSVWKYLDNGSNQGDNWKYSTFNDSSWKIGRAKFGYGGDGEATVLSYGGNSNNKYITYYFRCPFTVPSDSILTNLSFYLLVDDGAVVYIDGIEIFRQNMPQGTINYLTQANSAISGPDEQTFYLTKIDTILHSGTHIIAVEVHQSSATSTDLGFNMAVVYGNGIIAALPEVEATVVKHISNIELSVPSIYGDWRVFGYTNISQLLSGQGEPVPFTLIESNNQKYYIILPTEPVQFFRLQKP